MDSFMKKREFLAASVSLAALGLVGSDALAQSEHEAAVGVHAVHARRQIPRRKAKTTVLFKTPSMGTGNWAAGWPNALAIAPEGLWIGEQRHDGKTEAAWLMDWSGKLLKTVTTQSKDTSGIAYGDGYIWMGANTDKENGFFQTDMNSKLISVHQIPLGPRIMAVVVTARCGMTGSSGLLRIVCGQFFESIPRPGRRSIKFR
jgi:hypothetical protein